MTEIEKIMAGALVANLLGLNAKIIWDWLNSKKGEGPVPHRVGGENGNGNGGCPLHKLLEAQGLESAKTLEEMERAVVDLEKSFQVHEAVADERFADVRKGLERGQAVFDSIEKALKILSEGQASGHAIMNEINRRLIHLEQSRVNGTAK